MVTIFAGSILVFSLLPAISNAQTAELDVDFTRNYSLVWTDAGSGAAADVSFWRPEPPAGWFRVGHHMKRGFGNPTESTIIVRERVSGALATPFDYFLIWDDTGSGVARDGSVWRPSCPNGYRAMGDVTSNSHAKPSINEVACVRETALATAFAGSEIWNDTGSGAARDFGAWGISSPAADFTFTYASSGLFFAAASHIRPQPSSVGGLWAVKLPKASGPIAPQGGNSGNSADQQFWDTVKNSNNAQDFQGYLNAFPNGQFAALARFKMGQLPPANPGNPGGGGSPAGGNNADQQFWDTVKNSQNASDFQGYLNAFPNGQFAALARFKMGQLPQNNPGNPGGGNVGASNADQQFWDTVKNSQNATDFQGYLNAFPNGQFAALARFKMSQLPSGNPGVGTNSDQQFWDSVKNSQRASDFQGYLNAFPNGQFAALARFKMSQLLPNNPGNPGPVGSPGNLGQSRNAAFLNQVAATNRAKLPLTVGDIQLFDSFSICQSGCQQSDGNNESVIIRGKTPGIAKQNTNIGQIEQSLKSALLKGYCGSPEQLNNVTFGVDIDDMLNQKIGNFFINARDCNGISGTTGPGNIASTSPNAAFLNNSAAESRATLPITLGQIQLFDAASHCQSGCQVADNTESVTIRAKTPNLSRQDVSLGQIDQALRPLLVKTYCGTPEQKRSVPMHVDLDDRFNQKIGLMILNSRDCGGNAGNSGGNTGGNASSTGFQQVIAAAQPGSLSEIARARSFFVVSNDFNIKSKIASQLTKALPQLRAATSEQSADFLIGFELTDRTTGLVTPNDPANPNLKGELIVFTLIPAQNGRPESVRILFRVTKERGFGVFSATPDENAAKEFAKQFAKVII